MATKNLQYESGRSMVEMLGTLAIIGVLSVGGIAGYSYGMDKYKANQTMNDIMLMGVDIITQLSQNRGTPTLSSDWGTKTTAGYDFTVVQNPEDETQYGIQITGVPASICKQVGDGLKQTVAVYVGNENYNSDTETDPCDESDKNTMEFYFEHASIMGNECKTDTDCGENKYCDNGWCFSGEKPIGTPVPPICTTDADCGECSDGCVWDSYQNRSYCFNTQQNFGKTCTLSDGSNGMCYWGECIKTGCTYNTNKCEKGHYCSSPADYGDCQPFPDGKTGSCIKTDFRLLKIDGKSYYVSNTVMSWWDAEAACKTIGNDKKLIGVSELITLNNGTQWNNQTGTYLKTPLAEKLFEFTKYNFLHFWTENVSDNCSAYYVSDSGYVNTSKKENTNYFAVCR